MLAANDDVNNRVHGNTSDKQSGRKETITAPNKCGVHVIIMYNEFTLQLKNSPSTISAH